MTARARSIVSPLALIAAALALAYALSLIPTLGLAHGAPVAAAVSAPPMHLDPSAAVQPQLEPPVSAPQLAPATIEPTIDEVTALWRSGATVSAILSALYLALLSLARFDPRRALKWTTSAGVALMLAEAGRNGAVPPHGMWIGAIGTLLAAWAPGVVQSLARQRSPEIPRATVVRDSQRGSALLGLLAPLAACALVVLGAGQMWGCAGQAKATASDVGFCATAAAGPLVDDLQQAIVSNTDEAGHVNWDAVEVAVKERLLRYGREVVACATRRAIDRILETQTLVRVDREEFERGWQRLRAGVLAP